MIIRKPARNPCSTQFFRVDPVQRDWIYSFVEVSRTACARPPLLIRKGRAQALSPSLFRRGGAGIRRFASAKLLPIPATQLNTNKETQGFNPGSLSLWRCRESNPGPCRPLPYFYVCSRAIASRPQCFVRHCIERPSYCLAFRPLP
jgi:hypothetical protein